MSAKIRKLLILFFMSLPVFGAFAYTRHIFSQLPDELYIYKDRDTVVDLDIPVTAVVRETGQTVDFSKPVTFQAKEKANYSLEYKLFNLISLPSGKLSVLEENYLYAGGFPIGIYLKTDGVLVVDTAEFTDARGETSAPSAGVLMGGDYIVEIDGTAIERKSQVSEILENSDGSTMCVGFYRDDEYTTAQVTPVMNEAGEYKLGIWVKDDAQGIGTITYIDKDGNFGALGHGMSDSSSGELLESSNGFLYRTNIISITKGQDNAPGEYVGVIDYAYSNRLGLVSANRRTGIFGTLPASKCEDLISEYSLTPYEIGFGREVHKGEASVLVYLNGELKAYDIYIEEISYRDEKNITFRCTSDELIDITNGIVQGQSGSPIIQDNKIIGAVTHVFVGDSRKGYGIFIENMMRE
jgi:stage IV sporulation protein B